MYRWSLFEHDLYFNHLFDFLQVEKAVKYLEGVLALQDLGPGLINCARAYDMYLCACVSKSKKAVKYLKCVLEGRVGLLDLKGLGP